MAHWCFLLRIARNCALDSALAEPFALIRAQQNVYLVIFSIFIHSTIYFYAFFRFLLYFFSSNNPLNHLSYILFLNFLKYFLKLLLKIINCQLARPTLAYSAHLVESDILARAVTPSLAFHRYLLACHLSLPLV